MIQASQIEQSFTNTPIGVPARGEKAFRDCSGGTTARASQKQQNSYKPVTCAHLINTILLVIKDL
jgi:hypothetical protein